MARTAVAACSCASCPNCPVVPRGKEYVHCRPCAVGWHRPGPCDFPQKSDVYPIEDTCLICGFPLNQKGEHR